jgi:DNA gyrase subunit B
LAGDALAEVAREYILAEAVIERLSRRIDGAVLRALLRGVQVDLSSAEAAARSAEVLVAALQGEDVLIEPRFDESAEAHRLSVRRLLHGNLRLSVVDQDLLDSGDYAQIRKTAGLLQGLLHEGASVQRGEQKTAVDEFPQAVEWLLEQAKSGLTIQRYKGLGEMNPTQLWETTMDPASRRLLRAQIEDAIAADEIFTTLMGDVVEPRRAFIEANALGVRNLDI